MQGRFEESRKGRKVDALAHGGDANRDNLLEVLDKLYALKHKMGGGL